LSFVLLNSLLMTEMLVIKMS